jgi:hypothetical protein
MNRPIFRQQTFNDTEWDRGAMFDAHIAPRRQIGRGHIGKVEDGSVGGKWKHNSSICDAEIVCNTSNWIAATGLWVTVCPHDAVAGVGQRIIQCRVPVRQTREPSCALL